jgi:hypothetical protein
MRTETSERVNYAIVPHMDAMSEARLLSAACVLDRDERGKEVSNSEDTAPHFADIR